MFSCLFSAPVWMMIRQYQQVPLAPVWHKHGRGESIFSQSRDPAGMGAVPEIQGEQDRLITV